MVLTMILAKEWTTRQVDYTNAFVQADIKEDMYVEQPKGFQRKDKNYMVLKLFKALYGLKQAPKSFYDKISEGLQEQEFTQSSLDECLFMKKDMVRVIYVDNTAGSDPMAIEELIKSLGIAKDEQRHAFELRYEGEVGDFLGICIEKLGEQKFTLTQIGLISKVLKTTSMETCNPDKTHCVIKSLEEIKIATSLMKPGSMM